ncbi:MAG: ribonuclease, partial [Sodaliphilus sp.]|nr:ribonuclease [Sodaliphilus sp.]
MKRITFIFGLLLVAAFAGQAAKQPADYYKKAEGKKQKALLSQLCSIISANTRVISYENLFEDAYPYTDAEGGYLIDMYSNVKYSVNDSRINKNYSRIGQSIN